MEKKIDKSTEKKVRTKKKISKKPVKKSSNTKKKQTKAFTLIELLAVIIILGVLMIIAIPSVTTYISNSRKSTYIDTAKNIVGGVGNVVNEGKLGMYDTNTTYYIPAKFIKTENGLKSPYGEFSEAYIGVIFNGKGYSYYWISNDTSGQGVKDITAVDKLNEEDITSGIKDSDIRGKIETTGIGNRTEIQILNPDTGEWQIIPGGAVAYISEEGEESSGGSGNEPQLSKICVRATSVNSGLCDWGRYGSYSNYCGRYYYKNGSLGLTYKYGNENVTIGTLNSGDPFICDVNGDGNFDSVTERFYYVSDYYDTVNGSFDSTYAALIYYNNFKTTTACNDYRCTVAYDSSRKNYNGPVTAISYLPSTDLWSNVTLKNTTRKINGCSELKCSTFSSTTSSGSLPSSFSYEGKAARFLTEKELYNGSIPTANSHSVGLLRNHLFYFENTQFENDHIEIDGYWLEEAYSSTGDQAWVVDGALVTPYFSDTNYSVGYGVRPVIDVPKSRIDY